MKKNIIKQILVLLVFIVTVCGNQILIAQTTSKKTTPKKNTQCKHDPILVKEEIHHDTCFRIYNICEFNKWRKKWFTLGEIAYNIVLDSTINYGEFYFLDNATVDSKNDFFTIMNDKSVQNKAICKFYYNSPDPNFIDDPFKTGKYKHKNEKLPGF